MVSKRKIQQFWHMVHTSRHRLTPALPLCKSWHFNFQARGSREHPSTEQKVLDTRWRPCVRFHCNIYRVISKGFVLLPLLSQVYRLRTSAFNDEHIFLFIFLSVKRKSSYEPAPGRWWGSRNWRFFETVQTGSLVESSRLYTVKRGNQRHAHESQRERMNEKDHHS